MKKEDYLQIVQDKLKSSARRLGLGRSWVFQQNIEHRTLEDSGRTWTNWLEVLIPRSGSFRVGDLREKLQRSNLTEVSFMIVNEREPLSRAMYWELKRRAPPGVPVYQQTPFQSDVWEALDGDKDDFLVYDRCGLLTFHIVLPYSFLHYPYVEAAIRATYYKDICHCSANVTTASGGVMKNATQQHHTNYTTALPLIPV
ncbi:selenoprotein Pb isoform X2 [Entelurus aequoreus]|uniref:selenoprotein Pb isoform X2 n=1 Tax=Entelurus aequoreus TaxID=161455 RepID=UPI002B1D32E5|nr:selenoprotein Pb isoform X2 [Entelurus aequoreus]